MANDNLFESVITQSPGAIVITDANGKVEFVNNAFKRILGYSLEDFHPGFVSSILYDEESRLKYEELKKTISEGKVWRGELAEISKDQKVIYIRLVVFPLIEDGKTKNFIVIFTGFSDQKYDEDKRREKEIQHNFLLENLPLAIAIYDGTGKFLYANERTENLFGLEKGSLPGKKFHDVFPKETADLQMLAMEEVFKTRQPLVVDRNVNMNHKLFNFKVTLHPLCDEEGNVTSVLAIGENVTEKVRQAALFHIQHQIDSLSNLTANLTSSLKKAFQYLLMIDWIDVGGIYLFDKDRKHLRLIFSEGLSEDYLKAVSVYSTNAPQAKLVLKGKSRFANTRTFLKPLSDIILKEQLTFVVAIPLIYKKEVIGSLNLGSKTVEDIDSQNRLIIESIASRLASLIILVKTRDELLASNLKLNKSIHEKEEQQQLLIQKSRLESLGELSAGLAHEINQPLSIISLVMENIHYKMEQNAASVEYLSGKFTTISQNTMKIKKLIDHVRIFSRDQGTIMFERVDINQVITDSLSMIEEQLRSHQIKLTKELSDDLGFILGNPSRIEQVMLNLLSNSRDAVNEKEKKINSGSQQKEIRVKSYSIKSRIVVKVWDNGTGISKANLDKIYNPFFTTKTEGHGTGLGLAIVYGIIREMKGEIDVRSEVMEFTEITITLRSYKNIKQKLSLLSD